MKFSLILATVNRIEEPKKFMEYLACQSYKNYELILLDQNQGDEVKELIKIYGKKYEIKYIRAEKGLSKARNIGLDKVNGDIIAFPDDDCWYEENLLEKVVSRFKKEPIDAVIGEGWDFEKKKKLLGSAKEVTEINIRNVWEIAMSIGIFIKYSVVKSVGKFDEMIGVGSLGKYASGEETDYMIRVIKKGYKVKFFPEIKVYHPAPFYCNRNRELYRKAYLYGCGSAYVLKKHHYEMKMKLRFVLRPFLGTFLALLLFQTSKMNCRWMRFRGVLDTFME